MNKPAKVTPACVSRVSSDRQDNPRMSTNKRVALRSGTVACVKCNYTRTAIHKIKAMGPPEIKNVTY